MGSPPTVADRTAVAPTRAVGGDGGGTEGAFLRFAPERFGDMTGDSFCVRLRPPADSRLFTLPDGNESPERAARHKKEMSGVPQKQEPTPRAI
jgi:hypothetical protein